MGRNNHSLLHYETFKHPLSINVQRKRKLVRRDEPPHKMSKLAIEAETEADRYEYSTRVDCFECAVKGVDKKAGKLPQVVDGVMKANTFARQEEVKAWEQEITPCEHTLCLEQGEPRQIASQDLGQCAKCELKENLWLCLTCGNLGCGRAQFGGIGGNSHALAHGDEAKHPVAVKLGSLTAEGTADIYCYSCNDEKTDPELPLHLAHWGIDIADRQKTEKSLTEMQIEQNLRWEFSMQTEDGDQLKPLFGPGFTGMKNLGNSCYLASVLQCLLDMPEFAQRYHDLRDTPPAVPKPAEDLETQLRKLGDGLLSGRYARPDPDVVNSKDPPEWPHQRGLAPAMFKHLIGRGHAEFSTMRQQDAFEMLLHLLQLVDRSQHPSSLPNPVSAFKFAMEQRLQCLSCKKVRYRIDEMENVTVPVPIRRKPTEAAGTDADADTKMFGVNGTIPDSATPLSKPNKDQEKDEFEPVTFRECLEIFTASTKVELTCPACASKAGFAKRSLFKTFPAVLAVNCQRFHLVNWIPTKLDVPVIVGDEPVSLDEFRSPGLQPDEEVLPEDADVAPGGRGGGAAAKFVPDEMALAQLEAMGFPHVRCQKALKATRNTGADAATNWLFEHMEDPDIDVPDTEPDAGIAAGGGAGSGVVDAEKIEQLGAIGFSAPQARQALKETGGDMERAVDWLFNHPDATGDFGEDGGGEAQVQQNGGAVAGDKALAGSAEGEANFQLRSIVCHKGSSIHAG